MSQPPNLFDRLSKTKPLNFDHLEPEAAKKFRIKTNYGPEDFLKQTLPAGSERLIISCSRRRKKKKLRKQGVQLGFIDYLDLASQDTVAKTFRIEGYAHHGTMEPHGIAMATHEGQDYLYVISHEKRGKEKAERILKFRIGEDTLYFVYEFGEQWDQGKLTPNDLWVTDAGDIYFTNPRVPLFNKKHFLAYLRLDKAPNGEIKPFFKVLVKDLAFPNGIIRIEDKLYFTTTMQKKKSSLLYYILQDRETLDTDTKKRVVKIPGGDNITAIDDNLLLIANHPSIWRFFRHGSSARQSSPSSVYLVDLSKPKNENATQIFYSDGTFLSASSTALIHNNRLYIAQVFEDFIVSIPLGL